MIPVYFYCNSFNGKDPLHSQGFQKTLISGAYTLTDEQIKSCVQKQYLLDNTMDHISHLNPVLGDLTGLYWIWKNTNHEYVGTNQYRRFYDDNELNTLQLNKQSLYVSEFIDFGAESVWDQYIKCHTDLGIKILKKAIQHNTVPITNWMVDSLYTKNGLSSCNSFFAHKELFDRVCDILFGIMFELYEGCKYILDDIQATMHYGKSPSDKRLLAFLAERILNIIYFNSYYFLGTTNIIPIKYNLYQ